MKSLFVLYDNWCPNCIKFSRFIKKHDIFNLIKFISLRDEANYFLFPNLNISLAKNEMASWSNGWNYGFNSIYNILLRIPIFWIFLPMFFFFKITGVGKIIYNQLAVKRTIIPLTCNKETCKITQNF